MFIRKVEFDQTLIPKENLDTQIHARIEKLEFLQKQKPLLYGAITQSEIDSLKGCLSESESTKREALSAFDTWLKLKKNKILWDDFNVASPQPRTEAKNTSTFTEEITLTEQINSQRNPSVKIEFTYKATLFGLGNLNAQVQARIDKIDELARLSPLIRFDTVLKKKIENLKRYLPKSSLGYTTFDQRQHLISFDRWLQTQRPAIWKEFRAAATSLQNPLQRTETLQGEPKEYEKIDPTTKKNVVDILTIEKTRLMKKYNLQTDMKPAGRSSSTAFITQKQGSKKLDKNIKIAIERVQAIDKLVQETEKEGVINSPRDLQDKLTTLKSEMKSTGKWFSEYNRNSTNKFFASQKYNINKEIEVVSPKKESLFSRLLRKIRG